jgi:hypothetical protein
MKKMSRIERVLLVYGASRDSDVRNPEEPHALSQLQVACLCASHAAVVSSHGLKNKQCTCGNEDCKRPGKHPGTPHGLQDATTDLKLIEKFWTQWPKAKVIIATGVEDVLAVTVRVQKGGLLAYKALMGEEDEAPAETVEFFDRGIRTYLWRMAADAMPKEDVTLAEGITAHGRESFVVVPRALKNPTRSKHLYNREIAPAPKWLLRLLGAPDGPYAEDASDIASPERLPILKEAAPKSLPIAERTFDEKLKFDLYYLDLDWIVVPDDSPPCNEERVRALADSYRITGVRAPLAVREVVGERTRDSDPVFNLLSDPHRLEALKRHGIARADCFVVKGDETAERLWKLADLIHQPEVKVLDWAHLVMEWVRLIQEKGAQVAHPPGGRQPHDKGFSAARRVLGVSRRDLGRAERIVSISPEAQEVIRHAKLDDDQPALLEIADEPPEQQVAKAREIKERHRKPRGKRATKADSKPGIVVVRGSAPEGGQAGQEPAEEDDDEPVDESVESPATAPEETPGEVDQPSALHRVASNDEKLKVLASLFDDYMADEWEDTPAVVQVRFIKEVLGYSAVTKVKGDKSQR